MFSPCLKWKQFALFIYIICIHAQAQTDLMSSTTDVTAITAQEMFDVTAAAKQDLGTRYNVMEDCSESNRTEGTFESNSTNISCQNQTTCCETNFRHNDTISEHKESRNSGGLLSKDDYDYYMSFLDPISFSLHLLTAPLLLLTVISFARNMENSVSNNFIVALNSFEMASCIVNVVYFALQYSLGDTDKVYTVWVIVSNFIIVCCRRVVYILNLLMSAQRLLVVASPIKSRHSLLRKSRTFVFVGVPVFVFLFHIYLAMMYTFSEIQPGVFIFTKTEIYSGNRDVYENLGHFAKVFFSYLPLVLTIGINMALVRVIRHHNRKLKVIRNTMDGTGRARQDKQTTLMVLVSTLAYTFLSLPANINQMVSTFIETYGSGKLENNLYKVIQTATNATQTLGDLTNFVTYVCLSTTFRQQLFNTLMPGRVRTTLLRRYCGAKLSANSNGTSGRTSADTSRVTSSTSGALNDVITDKSSI